MRLIEEIRAKTGVVRAAAYMRTSSKLQRPQSIEAQKRAISDFARANDIEIVAEYFDRGRSGTSVNREEFQRMLEDAAGGGFDLVLVHKVDRFARSRRDSVICRQQLERNHVAVLAVAQPYDSESAEGMMMEAMLEAMAEYYSRNLATEVEKGKKENARKGLHVGGRPPLGYDVDKKTMQLVINPHEAKAVRLIFDIALRGGGYGDMMNELNARGYKTKIGGSFGKNSLFSILKNEKYTGTYVYSKSVKKDADGKRNGHRYKDDDEIIRVENAVPPIITREEFDTVQQLMQRRQQTKGRGAKAKEVYLLSGKIICGECGSAYVGQRRPANKTHPLYVSYVCGKHGRSVKCPNGEIRREAIEVHVLEQLSQLVFNDRIIPEIVDSYNAFLQSYNSGAIDEAKELRGRIAEADKALKNLADVLAQTPSPTLVDKLAELEQEKALLENELFILDDRQNAQRVTVDDLKAAFRQARKLLKKKTLPNLQALIDAFIDKVILYKDRVEIVFSVGMDMDILTKENPHQNARQSFSDADSIPPLRDGITGGEGTTRTLASRRLQFCKSFNYKGFCAIS